MITINAENSLYLARPYTWIPLPMLGNTGYTDVIFCPWFRDLFVQVTISGLGSGESVVLTVYGSLGNYLVADNTGWDNLAASGLATTLDTNATTLLKFPDKLPPYVRVGVTGTVAILTSATISIIGHIAAVA